MPRLMVPCETHPGETRVAATPDSVKKLAKLGFEVFVEAGAGAAAGFSDASYSQAGATVVPQPVDADVVLVVRTVPEGLKTATVLLGLLDPLGHRERIDRLREQGLTVLPLELLPRTTKAQSMDALSSQANLAGYKAALLTASELDRYMPLLMTAAGTVKPSRVVIMGAGVAGLQALATCKRLGAIVEVSDIRPAVEEEVKSLGGRFIELPTFDGDGGGGYARQVTPEFLQKQRAIVADRVAAADAVITTAAVPGRKAPVLLTQEMVERMRPGSVIVDLAVATGGNCALSQPGQTVEHHGVRIFGPLDLATSAPRDGSTLYASNLANLLAHVVKDGGFAWDFEDEITAGVVACHAAQWVNPRMKEQP